MIILVPIYLEDQELALEEQEASSQGLMVNLTEHFQELASQVLEEPEGGASEAIDADCKQHQPAGKLQFDQYVP